MATDPQTGIYYDGGDEAQDVMDKAYKFWNLPEIKPTISSFDDFIRKAGIYFQSPKLPGFISVCKLNQQVQNGGLSQWTFNGYSKSWRFAKQTLLDIATPESIQTIDIVTRYNVSRSGYNEEKCTNEYYKIDDKIEKQLIQYAGAQFLKIIQIEITRFWAVSERGTWMYADEPTTRSYTGGDIAPSEEIKSIIKKITRG